MVSRCSPFRMRSISGGISSCLDTFVETVASNSAANEAKKVKRCRYMSLSGEIMLEVMALENAGTYARCSQNKSRFHSRDRTPHIIMSAVTSNHGEVNWPAAKKRLAVERIYVLSTLIVVGDRLWRWFNWSIATMDCKEVGGTAKVHWVMPWSVAHQSLVLVLPSCCWFD